MNLKCKNIYNCNNFWEIRKILGYDNYGEDAISFGMRKIRGYINIIKFGYAKNQGIYQNQIWGCKKIYVMIMGIRKIRGCDDYGDTDTPSLCVRENLCLYEYPKNVTRAPVMQNLGYSYWYSYSYCYSYSFLMKKNSILRQENGIPGVKLMEWFLTPGIHYSYQKIG